MCAQKKDATKNVVEAIKTFGCGIEYMPNFSFRIMSFILSLRDIFSSVEKKLNQFDIENSSIVVDFGCGPEVKGTQYLIIPTVKKPGSKHSYPINVNSYVFCPLNSRS